MSVASSTAAAPDTTSPSTGMTSPGRTRTRSPGRSARRSTLTVIGSASSPTSGSLSATTSLASSGSKVDNDRRSEAALALARDSSARPRRMNARSSTGSSKKSLLTGTP